MRRFLTSRTPRRGPAAIGRPGWSPAGPPLSLIGIKAQPCAPTRRRLLSSPQVPVLPLQASVRRKARGGRCRTTDKRMIAKRSAGKASDAPGFGRAAERTVRDGAARNNRQQDRHYADQGGVSGKRPELFA